MHHHDRMPAPEEGRLHRKPPGPARLAGAGAAVLFAALLAPLGGLHPAHAAGDLASEAEVKAAMLYNFALFIGWPENAHPGAEAPFVIGVVGVDPLGPALDLAVEGKRIRDRRVTVRRWASVETARAHLRDCQLLYVSDSEAPDVPALLAALRDNPVVTVSSLPGFARQGGHVEFFLEAHRIRFEINPGATDRCGLRVSSKLLSLARLTPAPKHAAP